MPALTAKEIALHLKTVPHWAKRAKTITRTFALENFSKSIAFVGCVARIAQSQNHHPDIDIRFDRVTLKLTTHEEGGLTGKDFALAQQCDEVFARRAGPPKPIGSARLGAQEG